MQEYELVPHPDTPSAEVEAVRVRIVVREGALLLTFIVGDDTSDYLVEVEQPLSDLPDEPFDLGLTAVIEEVDGTKSYWALAHAPGPPDFHNRDCWIATVPAAGRP